MIVKENTMKLLLLEDERHDADLIITTLRRSGLEFEVVVASDRGEFLEAITDGQFDAVLSDNTLPQFNAVTALKMLRERQIFIPFILVTGTTSDEFAVEIMKEGAYDYVLKDRLHRLASAIRISVNNYRNDRERQIQLEKIIKSESLMKEAERLAHFGSWEVEKLHNYYTWSDEYYRMLDYEVGSVPPNSDSFYARVHPDDLEFVKATFELAMNTLDNHRFECRILLRNGDVRHLDSKVHFFRDASENIVRINGIAMDITETKQADALLKKTELSYKRVVENILDGLIIDDKDGKITFANDQFLKIFGFSRNDLTNMRIEDYVAPEYRYKLRLQHEMRMAGDRVPGTFEFVGVRKDGERRWLEVSTSKIMDNGKIVGSQSAIKDITKAKISEELRLQSEANLRAIFDNTDIGYVLLNKSLRIISFNPFVFKLSFDKVDRKPVIGRLFTDCFGEESRPLVQEPLSGALLGGNIQAEYELLSSDGSKNWFSIGYSSILDNGNHVIGVLVSVRNITLQKQLEFQGQAIKDDLIRRNHDLEQFAYITSHNLRAPVASIMGLCQLLLENGLETHEISQALNDLNYTAQKLDDIIRDINKILTINKDISESREVVDFEELVTGITDLLKQNYSEVGFEVMLDFKNARSAYSIKSYLHSIFMNLISNSIKYRKPNVNPKIEIISDKTPSCVHLLFRDNGVGIDMARNGHKIFGLYNRFHHHVEGRGMGLFMVKTQVELLGGSITLQSKENIGSEFKVTLPFLN